ncbi:MAG TPA: NfeD family protein [Ktedonobacterales bacterium]|nr:NfeD family protein [Ktedonobacterales bacterium]
MRLKSCPPWNSGQTTRTLALAAIAILVALGVWTVGALGAPSSHAAGPRVDVVAFDQDVSPASARFTTGAIQTARADGSVLLVIEMDTPGGDLESMKAISQAILASPVPIVVYVTPAGGRAASAGALIAFNAPIIAMAPGTRIGAASPIDSAGQNLPSTLDTKVKNDLLAMVRSVQQAYHRAEAPAEQTVANAASFTDQEALANGMINLRATSRSDLLAHLNGTTITLFSGKSVAVQLAGLPITLLEPTLADQVQGFFLDPTVLFLLFIVAAVCIYLELAHPGAIVPGTIGAIALLLFLLGAGALNPNWTGLALMLLAIVLLAIDVRVPTHGVLSAGALISLALGSFIFFDTGVDRGTQLLSPIIIGGVVVGVGLIALFVLQYAIRSQRWPVRTGSAGLVGQQATVLSPLAPDGRVRVLGEDWSARLAHPESSASVEPGASVRVVRVEGLRVFVEPVTSATKDKAVSRRHN